MIRIKDPSVQYNFKCIHPGTQIKDDRSGKQSARKFTASSESTNTMKKLNNRWYDENNNSWNANLETKESALAKSKTLSDCSGCSDCRDCSNCSGCSGCRDCNYCSDCIGCSDCSGCNDCSGCSNCRGCSGYKTNAQRYITAKIGSRNSQMSIYWTNKDDVQIFCGCWKGNIKDFEKRVKEVHAKTEHLKPYLAQIKIFKMLVNQK